MAAQALVLDNGSSTIKAGFAGEDTPHAVFPSLVGHVRQAGLASSSLPALPAHYVGEAACSRRELLSLSRPLERGLVVDWDDAERLWQYAFSGAALRVAPEEHSLLLSEAPLTPRASREKLSQVLFETFNTPALCLANQATLSLYASGRTTGLVLDAGHEITRSVPIFEGFAIPHATRLAPSLGGLQLEEHLLRMLVDERRYRFRSVAERELVRQLPELLCYVALDYELELHTAACTSELERSYELPDGRLFVTLGAERFRCPEALFQPSVFGFADSPGIHQCIVDSISRCDPDLSRDLYGNVVLSGGTSLFAGLADRLYRELGARAPPTTRIRVIAPPERKHSAWIGGSILASLPVFRQLCVSRQEYEEYGASVVHKRCF
mmetsp:Transcript_27086/g.68032  ORF Transcript_27086/g.68032 Transcript_27086/m.68032 type:complete len:381 (+) Transcript_27086:319-1461(+)